MITSALIVTAASLIAARPLLSLVPQLRRFAPSNRQATVTAILYGLTAVALALVLVDWTIVPAWTWWIPTTLLAVSTAHTITSWAETPKRDPRKSLARQRAAVILSAVIAVVACTITAITTA